MKKLYTIQEIQAILGVPVYTINYHIQTHKIPISKKRFGLQRIFNEADLELLIKYFANRNGGKSNGNAK